MENMETNFMSFSIFKAALFSISCLFVCLYNLIRLMYAAFFFFLISLFVTAKFLQGI